MYGIVIAFGIASTMLALGTLLRGKLHWLQNTIMPSAVIGGIIGLFLFNLITEKIRIVSVKDFSSIVDVFFVLSFISIGLTGKTKSNEIKKEKKRQNSIIKGAFDMGLVWCALYGITPIIGIGVLSVIGKTFDMDPMYGILIPFGFCQGPGQAATYGKLFEETYGYANAEMVSITFAVIGFLAAFLVGIPLAKYGLKLGYTRNKRKIDSNMLKGYYYEDEKRETLGIETTHSGNIDTITLHFSVIGVTYLIALGLAKVISLIPGFGETLAAMLFLWGLVAAYIVKSILQKFRISYLLDNVFLSHITGFLSDYLIICAFMSIQLNILGKYIFPILIISILSAIITLIISMYFGARFGSDHDFERILGLYGTSTGTIPSGISLIRIVDPYLSTSTVVELGMMNLAMMFSTPVMIFITLAGMHKISICIAIGGIVLSILFYFIILKISRGWNQPSFYFKKDKTEVV